MERRRESRHQTKQPVRLTLLGEQPGQNHSIEGTILDFSGRGLRVEVTESVTPGAAVRLDMKDQLMLGEVCYCQRAENGNWALGLQMEQALSHLEDLSHLMSALMGDGGRMGVAPQRVA
ncbi:MAG: PilZ domain-containing protein [Acidobacteria bacterium]|nr:PilZ domain-containing protein [Acidobacteriota bacterium]